MMKIEFDPEKREFTLVHRGLDMDDAKLVFEGKTWTWQDDRHDYGEDRFISVGHLNNRMVFIAWTPRNGAYRIINMRKANEREQEKYKLYLD